MSEAGYGDGTDESSVADGRAQPGGEPLVVEEVDLAPATEELDRTAWRLWRKALRAGTWDPAAISFDADRRDYEALDPGLRLYLERFCAAFHAAEDNVARLFGPWVMAAPTTWSQAFLSTQLVEEHKHTEVFARFFDEVVGHDPQAALANPVHDSLSDRATRLLQLHLAGRHDAGEERLAFAEAVAHYMGVIEGVQANAGYQIFRAVFASKGILPGLTEGFANVQHDEGRHVGFGMAVLRQYAAADPACATRIRELFEGYLPLIRARYGQPVTDAGGTSFAPPPEERGVERLMVLYERRLRDIFGADSRPG